MDIIGKELIVGAVMRTKSEKHTYYALAPLPQDVVDEMGEGKYIIRIVGKTER